jgi:hypothetical protein
MTVILAVHEGAAADWRKAEELAPFLGEGGSSAQIKRWQSIEHIVTRYKRFLRDRRRGYPSIDPAHIN